MTRVSSFLFAGVAVALFVGSVVACSSSDTAATPAGSSGTIDTDSGPIDTTPDADTGDETSSSSSSSSSSGGTQCTSARDTLLVPVAKVSTGAVTVVGTAAGVTTLYVDASAGGVPTAYSQNPRTYITLADGAQAKITDKDAPTSNAWDIALKRTTLFTNSGDAGLGKGGGLLVKKAFDAVTAADATSVAAESFFDADCKARTDENLDVVTTFTGWYAYDDVTHIPSPAPNVTFIVKSAAGTLYKVGITSYQGKPTGDEGGSTGNYLLKVAPL